jgi:hypothetical protein
VGGGGQRVGGEDRLDMPSYLQENLLLLLGRLLHHRHRRNYQSVQHLERIEKDTAVYLD